MPGSVDGGRYRNASKAHSGRILGQDAGRILGLTRRTLASDMPVTCASWAVRSRMRSGCAPGNEFRRRSPWTRLNDPDRQVKAWDRCTVPVSDHGHHSIEYAPSATPIPEQIPRRLLRDARISATCSARA